MGNVIQHLVTGRSIESWTGQTEAGQWDAVLYDTSLEGLGRLYNVPWEGIADATFGGHRLADINGWLQSRGIPQSSGMWSFKPGMIVNVPYDGMSKSPVEMAAEVGVTPEPGGQNVAVGPSDPGAQPSSQAAVATEGMPWIPIILGGLAIWYLMGQKTKPRRGRSRGYGRRSRSRRRR
jgi:hypothetical protein